MSGTTWSVRAHSDGGPRTRVHAGSTTFDVGEPLRLGAGEPLPSALDHLLGALAADLVRSFALAAAEAGIDVEQLECRVAGELEDPLAGIGVVGAGGSPALAAVTGTFYVSAEAAPDALQAAWRSALARSPLHATLARCTDLSIELRPQD